MNDVAIISELPKGYIDVEDAARVIGVSYSQCCRYIESGLLPARPPHDGQRPRLV